LESLVRIHLPRAVLTGQDIERSSDLGKVLDMLSEEVAEI
jgi:hypothetical protein